MDRKNQPDNQKRHDVDGSYLAMIAVPENYSLKYFEATWQVPQFPDPDAYGTDPFYIWNGVCPRKGSQIIQPVLAWQRGGRGSKDDLPGWVVNVVDNIDGSYINHDHHLPVKPGETVTGFIQFESVAVHPKEGRTEYTYLVGFKGDVPDQKDYFTPTQIKLVTPVPYDNPILCVEPWKKGSVDGYPNQDSVAMTNIIVEFYDNISEQRVSSGPHWQFITKGDDHRKPTPSNRNGEIISDSINGGEVRFYFK
ncbi:hypothetical protein [Spartinivicinus ruber]|uniref:hypothetical protein n=1 Tax=Spartinivicinus ruber TaxID=2683272 RepID=UPI0013D0393F|nr:hypothetical protein [Spartinivicinus ruber]